MLQQLFFKPTFVDDEIVWLRSGALHYALRSRTGSYRRGRNSPHWSLPRLNKDSM